MAKVIKTKKVKRSPIEDVFPLEKTNYYIIGVGLVFIVLGYIALSEKSVEGFLPLVVAPILLVLGYCIIIPIGILYNKKEKPRSSGEIVTSEKVKDSP